MRRLVLVLVALVAAWLVACAVLFVWPPAEALVRRGVAPVLAISSVAKTPDWKTAVGLCRRGRYAGARVLCFEANPYSTRGEARAIARIAHARGWHSIVVVSSTYHLTRASLLFHRCFAGKLSFVGASPTWWLLPYDWANETAKLPVQALVERGC